MTTYCYADPKTPEVIGRELDRIAEALGDALCTHDRPCAASPYYDEGKPLPWRISDDHNRQWFATVEEAIDAAEDWYEE